ncbi:MAG: hypothetical protein JEZ11_04545 [Desulfobacterales bacterium]|nr:hypothetical protein [Desulfobacterales bacterium]
MSKQIHRIHSPQTPPDGDVPGTSGDLKLVSGRRISATAGETEDLLEVFAPDGNMVLKVRLTESGPVMVVEGCRLEMTAAASISLQAPQIDIRAEKNASIKSDGTLQIDAVEAVDVHSDDDVRVVGKFIRLN